MALSASTEQYLDSFTTLIMSDVSLELETGFLCRSLTPSGGRGCFDLLETGVA